MTQARLPADFLELIKCYPIGVAVSGGSDSMALLHLLLRAKAEISVATVHHHLREEAGREAAEVGLFCKAHNLSHDVLDWHWDGVGNLQDQARRGRYQLLSHWANNRGVQNVALGHTSDDNAETFLMGLSRGAGLDGLSGMRPSFSVGAVTFHRPLLDVSRQALRSDLRDAGIVWSDDPSNDNLAYHRVRVRQALDALVQAGVDRDALVKTIGNLRATREDVTAKLAADLAGRFTYERGDLCIDLDWLQHETLEVRRRVVRSALRVISGEDYPPRGEKLTRLATQLDGKSSLQGCMFIAEATTLRVTREYAAVAKLSCKSTDVWDGRWQADGPHTRTTELRALGEDGIRQCPTDWRDCGLPRASVLAAPSVWEGATLRSAPLTGWPEEWEIQTCEGVPELFGSILLH